MEDAYNLLLQIIANSPTEDKLANLDSLDGTEKFLIFKPGEKRPYLVEKNKVTFPGEVPTKLADLDTPSLTGQKGKILVVKQDETGYEHTVLAEVTGVTQQELNDAIAGVEAKITTSSPNEVISFIPGYQSGLTYQPYAKFTVDGVVSEDSRSLTADPADATLDRYDVFAIEKATKQIVIIKGTAANPRTYPTVDPLTHLDSGVFIDIPAGATAPPNITSETLYSEGGESTITADPAYFDTVNTENPASGTKAIKTLQALPQNTAISFTPAAPIPVTQDMALHYKMANITGGNFYWIFQGNDANGVLKNAGSGQPSNYDAAATSYQFLSNPIAFSALVDIRKVMLVSLSNTLEFYLDEVSFSSGAGGVESGVTREYVDAGDAATLQAAKDYADTVTGDPAASEWEYFAGDGSTSGFTVTGTLTGIVLVEIDGRIQKLSTDYTVSGSTVTFGAAPYDGATIGILKGTLSPVQQSTGHNMTKVPYVDTATFDLGSTISEVISVDVIGSSRSIFDAANSFTGSNITINQTLASGDVIRIWWK